MSTLYVVATPIGNLGDLSPNMAKTLEECDIIAAEDTRVTQKLLAHLQIHKPMVSCHRHNEQDRAKQLVERMSNEELIVALVSDAGTPGLSDPGAYLVGLAAQAGISIVPICGPSAVAAALSVSGFEGASFAFHGFLPREEGSRRQALATIAGESCPVAVVYESPHRVTALVASIVEELPQASLCLCCDISKRYETILRGTPPDVLTALQNNPKANKGEYVLVMNLSACTKNNAEEIAADAHGIVWRAILAGQSGKEAVSCAVKEGIGRNEAYQAMLSIKDFLQKS